MKFPFRDSESSIKQGEIFALLATLFLLMLGIEKIPKPCPPIICPQEPQIIPIPSELTFVAGKAVPRQGPERLLYYVRDKIAPKIDIEIAKDPTLNVIEVIGHTDYLSISRTGDLDGSTIHKLARLQFSPASTFEGMVKGFNELNAGSNADLGLIRALIIVKTLEYLQYTGECGCGGEDTVYRAYSAAQLYEPKIKEFAQHIPEKPQDSGDDTRRRIEIRFTTWNPPTDN